MTPQSLLASAGINFGLALIVLALFSILKNQPSNAYVYFARPLSEDHSTVSFAPFSYRRFLPSISWISRAWHVSEDDILHRHGLDALVIFRLFKFGINFFVVCSLVGLIILLPLNYSCHDWPVHPSESMSTFTISNVPAGSNWLWVHFSCLWLVSFYGLYLLYKRFFTDKTIGVIG